MEAGNTSFARRVAVLMTGTTIAQLVPLAIAPILTRLYTPEQFGELALFIALTTNLGVIATGRYELAIVLPDDERRASDVFWLTIALSAAICSLAAVVAVVAAGPILLTLGAPRFGVWLQWVAPAVWIASIYLALTYWATRLNRFGYVAGADVLLKTSSEGAKWLLGLDRLRWTPNGLVGGTIAGSAVATAVLAGQIARAPDRPLGMRDLASLRTVAAAYRRFPTFTLAYSLVASVSNDFLVLALSSFGYLGVAGLFGHARRLIVAPISFLSSTLGRVFFQEAARDFGTPALEQLAFRQLDLLARLASPLAVFGVFWAPDIFAIVFGPEWRDAGWVAALLAPHALGMVFTSWPERIYEVAQRQHISFTIQLVADICRIGSVVVVLRAGYDPFVAIGVYGLLSVGYHAAYLYGVFVVAGFDRSGLRRLVVRLAVAIIPLAMLLAATRATMADPLARCAVDVALTGAWLGVQLRPLWRARHGR